MKILQFCSLLALTLPVVACSSLPASGPTTGQIAAYLNSTAAVTSDINVIALDRENVVKFSALTDSTVGISHMQTTPRQSTIKSGDRLNVQFWEGGASGVLASQDGVASIEVTVDREGIISLPFVGSVKAAGLTRNELQDKLQLDLQGKILSPTTLVEITKSPQNAIAIIGGSGSGMYPLQYSDNRLLTVVAASGPLKHHAHEIRIDVTRSDETKSARLSDLIKNPFSNIELVSGDVLSISHAPSKITTFGAVRNPGLIPIPYRSTSLEQGLALSGGLNDRQGAADGIYIFRLVDSPNPTVNTGRKAPHIYKFSLKSPEGFFVAREFELADNDIIYVAPATSAELNKFITLVAGPFLAGAEDFSNIRR